jgi:Cu-processing system permease protein
VFCFMISRILAISLTTQREIIRSKILYSIFFFISLVMALSTFYGNSSLGDQVKIIKDFGLMSMSLFSVAFCVIAGASLLSKELARKTVYNILGKHVYRGEFLVGKFLGVFSAAVVMIMLMGAVLTLYISFFERRLDLLLFQAYFYILLELFIVCALTIFFSAMVVTPALVGLFTFSVFLAGRSAEQVLRFAELSGTSFPRFVYYVIPHLSDMTVANEVVYGKSRSCAAMIDTSLYSILYASILLLLGTWMFRKRQFN